jgi:hypothetical protein
MPDITYWTGAVSENATTAGNWTNGLPIAADDYAIFDRGSVNVDPSQGNNAAFGKLIIRPGYTGTIGGSGNKMTSSITEVIHQGTADLWLDDAAGTTTDVYIRCASSNVVVQLGGNTMTNITLLRGNVTLDGGLGVCSSLQVGYVTNILTDVKCSIVTNASAITLCRQWGGHVTNNKTITVCSVRDGFHKIPVGTSGTLGTVYQEGGRVENFGVGTMTLLSVGPGVFDLGLEAKTITKSMRLPGGTILNADSNIHTFTAPLLDLADVT